MKSRFFAVFHYFTTPLFSPCNFTISFHCHTMEGNPLFSYLPLPRPRRTPARRLRVFILARASSGTAIRAARSRAATRVAVVFTSKIRITAGQIRIADQPARSCVRATQRGVCIVLLRTPRYIMSRFDDIPVRRYAHAQIHPAPPLE